MSSISTSLAAVGATDPQVAHPSSSWATTLRFSMWPMYARIGLAFWVGVTILAGGIVMRFRAGTAATHLYPNVEQSQAAPHVKTFQDLSLFAIALGVAMITVAVHRWLGADANDGR